VLPGSAGRFLKMTAHIIALPIKSYIDFVSALPPSSRFVDVGNKEFPDNHFWLYDPTGEILVFTPEPYAVIKRDCFKLEGFDGTD
jgi:hypothetical protein